MKRCRYCGSSLGIEPAVAFADGVAHTVCYKNHRLAVRETARRFSAEKKMCRKIKLDKKYEKSAIKTELRRIREAVKGTSEDSTGKRCPLCRAAITESRRLGTKRWMCSAGHVFKEVGKCDAKLPVTGAECGARLLECIMGPTKGHRYCMRPATHVFAAAWVYD